MRGDEGCQKLFRLAAFDKQEWDQIYFDLYRMKRRGVREKGVEEVGSFKESESQGNNDSSSRCLVRGRNLTVYGSHQGRSGRLHCTALHCEVIMVMTSSGTASHRILAVRKTIPSHTANAPFN